MGNEVHKCLNTKKDVFIKCNRIAKKGSQISLNSIQKLFGSSIVDTSNHPLCEESIVVHKEIISHKYPPIKELKDQDKEESSHEQISQEQISREESKCSNCWQAIFKEKPFEEEIVSLACSPVKKEIKVDINGCAQHLYQRQRHHYFRLKGCEVKIN